MTSLAMLMPIALFMGLCSLGTFFWALRGGQFEDLEGAANRILIDDEQDDTP
ncbi:MAG: cbb3-type cytochrome oxidase assembly protein CcoS [Novosphingobium sp.]|jgi:cbb3-type cytochrome oxidase maturation protein|nr:cbb3-type cytochrome oxidase assembly protein CcoS [Novosphingobium sp.]